MKKRILIALAFGLGLAAVAAIALAFGPAIFTLGCFDDAYKGGSACDMANGMYPGPVDAPNQVYFSIDGVSPFPSVLRNAGAGAYTTFHSDLYYHGWLTVSWTPGGSGLEQYRVSFDAISQNSTALWGGKANGGILGERLGWNNLYYYTEVFDLGVIEPGDHSLSITVLSGDGLGIDAIELSATISSADIDVACDPSNNWRNHGEYVRCAANIVSPLVDAGIITEEEASALMNPLARSDVGKP